LGNGRSAKLSWMAQDYHPGGAVGNAALANQQLGQQLISAAGRAFASLLSEVVALPLSTLRD
jgi:creatinine amidohydrolase